jgi:hypothetical protein
MTLWQEQRERQGTTPATAGQPRSRREARDAERRANETGDLSGVHPSQVYDLNSSGNIWDTLSRRAASQLTDAATEAERRTGRRVTDADAPAEPLSYIAQGRPQVPTYDSRRPSIPGAYQQRSFAPEPILPEAEDTRTRPTSRIDSILGAATPSAAVPSAAVSSAAPRLLADEEPVADLSASLDHTMTRRALRAMRETGQVPSLAPVSANAWMPAWEPTIAPAAEELAGTAFSSYTDSATVEMSAVDRAAVEAEVPVTFTPELVDDEPGLDTVLMDRVQPELSPLPKAFVAPLAEPLPKASVPPRVEPMPAPAARTFTEVPSAPMPGLQGFEALIAQASAGLEGPDAPATGPQPQMARQERPYTPPAGHWSVQAQYKDDEELPFEGMLGRSVGTSSGSTNALIMSKDPHPNLFSAVNSTGEIMITGSLDLPRILSSTGAPSEQYDSSEIDRLFEASQEEHHTADVAPVRAARAVSTHTSTRSVVSPRKSRGAMLPTVLAITAALMALGVVGLLFAGYVLRIF